MADGRGGFDLRDLAHTMLRIVGGLMLMQHGLQKLFGALGGYAFARMRFAGIDRPRRDHLVANFVLTRPIRSERLFRVEQAGLAFTDRAESAERRHRDLAVAADHGEGARHQS